ncbi:MAG: hypothetical protein AB7Q29_07015 [Vicinamibacterales bacterium]
MKSHRLAGVALCCLLTAVGAGAPRSAWASPAADDAPGDGAPLFRVFLKDGATLVSYGELARVDDRVVFSMPTSASAAAPQLQLVNIPADRVDWDRTLRYAESARASRYIATRAERDYAQLTAEIGDALNEVGSADSPSRRLALAERARKALAEWPAGHYNYKHDDVQQMLGILDEAIADLRAAAGASSFDLSLVATPASPPPPEPLLPPPSAREAIEQTLLAARLTDAPAERMSLLTVVSAALDSQAEVLPAEWATATRVAVREQIAHEIEVDRQARAVSDRLLRLATARARLANVRGVQRVLAQVPGATAAIADERPDTVRSIAAAVEQQLDFARRLRLERDRWALRAPKLRAYRQSIALPLVRMQRITPLLEDIKTLAGSGPDAIGAILRGASQILTRLSAVQPPAELGEAHALLISAAQLAEQAAKVRREAAINGSMTRAWDASSAAAGALMLASRAVNAIQAALKVPQTVQ